LVTVDFATRALNMPVPAESGALRSWYDTIAARPGATA
jgi:glutathione S-transferase